MIDLSIIIVSFNARADLERCLDSLAAPPVPDTREIVVVDNGSTDGSVDAARNRSGVRVLEAGGNRGFAAGTNIGIRASRGTYLLLLNSDTIVPPGAPEAMLAELRRDATVGVLGPRLVDGRGRPELSFGRMIGPLAELRQKRLVHALNRGEPWAVRRVERMTSRRQYPDWVSGACLLVSRADAEAVGLLDERFFLYTEDVDFCASIRALGKRVLFTPEIEIVHLRGRSAAAAPTDTRRAYLRSHLAFYEKHHPRLAPFLRWYRAWRS